MPVPCRAAPRPAERLAGRWWVVAMPEGKEARHPGCWSGRRHKPLLRLPWTTRFSVDQNSKAVCGLDYESLILFC
eukprot:scaffold29156_cov44-Phaeocystis_antarctica.AAC.1